MATETDEGEDAKKVSPHVHVKIGRDKKRKWLEYAAEHYRGNLSTLVVDSVDKALSKHWVYRDEEELDEDPRVDVVGHNRPREVEVGSGDKANTAAIAEHELR